MKNSTGVEMDYKLTLYFGISDAPEYRLALQYAAMFEKFTAARQGNKLNAIETTNREVLAKYDVFQKLIDTVGNWDSASVSLRLGDVDPISFYLSIKDVAECYLDYDKAADKDTWCDDENSDCWGCRQLKGITLQHARTPHIDNKKYWYNYGNFASQTVWSIDKEELSRALTGIVEKKCIDFCPVFQPTFYRKIVAQLPSYIDLSDKENWGQVYLDEIITDVKQWRPINIHHKSSSHDAESLKKHAHKAAKPFSRNKANAEGDEPDNKNLRNIPLTSFDDIGGIEDIIQNIREVIELPIKQPALFDYMGIRPYRGILLWGEPGNGKTLIAKAIAHEVEAHFMPIAGPDILNKSFGESEKNLREIFEEARSKQPSIIFIDEIDAIAQARLAGETSKWYATVVNQLLALMDGIMEFGNVTVMASTNRPDLLDPALLRPGRFDYKLEVKKPNLHGCKKILEIVTQGMPLSDDVDLFSFSEVVMGLSAADIAFIAKEAALVAIRRSLDVRSIITDDFPVTDYSGIYVKRSDLFSAFVTLKKNNKYTNKTYSLKG